jgi:hypothetical protein
MIEEIIQSALSENLAGEYLLWELYRPTKDIKTGFANILRVLGSPIATFKSSYPTQRPKQVVESNDSGDALLQTSVYRIDVLSLPRAISKKMVLRPQNSISLYQPTIEAGSDLIGRNVSLEIKLIS